MSIEKRAESIMLCLNNVCNTGYTVQKCDYDFIDKQIYEIKKEAADVQPITHGKWIYVGSVRSWDEIKCSACNSAFSTEDRDLILNWDFCPRCGAKMDAEPDEPWQSE